MKYRLFLIPLIFSTKLIGQINVEYIGFPQIIIKPGYVYQSSHWLQVDCAIGGDYGSFHGLAFGGFGLGSKIMIDKNTIISPYFFGEHALDRFPILSGRLSIVPNFRNGDCDLRINPEIGITLASVIDITCGYNLPLNDNRFNEISRFSFNLRIATTIQHLGKKKNKDKIDEKK